MAVNCEKCLKSIKARTGVKCGSCASVFHIKCAEIPDEILKGLKAGTTTWLCPDCRSTSNTSIFDDAVPTNSNDAGNDVTLPNLADIVTILKGIQGQLASLKTSVNFLCQSLEEIKLAVADLNEEAKRFDQRLQLLETKTRAQADQINTLEALLDRSAQQGVQNNIILCGIPPSGDDIPGVILKICNEIGVIITKEDLVSIKPMSHIKETTSLFNNAFIVTLKSAELKHNIINSFRRRKTLFVHELGTHFSMALENRKIFILHHLTKFQSRLYNAAKMVKNKHNFKFLWCKNNIIYLRERSDTKVYPIDSFNHIAQFDNFPQPLDSSPVRTAKPPPAVTSESQLLD